MNPACKGGQAYKLDKTREKYGLEWCPQFLLGDVTYIVTGVYLVAHYPRIVLVGLTNPGDFNGIFVGAMSTW